MIKQTRRTVLSGAAALALASAGCGATGGSAGQGSGATGPTGPLTDNEFDQLVEDAKAEGQLTFYCVPGEETMRTWIEPFQKEYGIQVELYRATVSDVNRRFTEESTAGKHIADVVSMSVPTYVQDAVDQGWAVQYEPQSHDQLDPKLITAEAGYPLYAVISSIAWNENEVSPELQNQLSSGDYQTLLTDELNGRVGIVAPTAGGTQLGCHLAIVADESLGWEYLESLIENGAAVFESSVPFVANDLSAGEYAVGIGVPDSVAIPRIYEGSPVRLSYPTPAPASMHQFFLSANAPHGAAGRLFLEWGTSLEGQDELATVSGGLVGHEKWKDQREIRDKSWYNPPSAGIDTDWQQDLSLDDSDEFIEEWLDRIG